MTQEEKTGEHCAKEFKTMLDTKQKKQYQIVQCLDHSDPESLLIAVPFALWTPALATWREDTDTRPCPMPEGHIIFDRRRRKKSQRWTVERGTVSRCNLLDAIAHPARYIDPETAPTPEAIAAGREAMYDNWKQHDALTRKLNGTAAAYSG